MFYTLVYFICFTLSKVLRDFNDHFSGRKRRLGLLGPKRTTITVHRSEEIVPAGMDRQYTCDSEGETEIFIPDTISER